MTAKIKAGRKIARGKSAKRPVSKPTKSSKTKQANKINGARVRDNRTRWTPKKQELFLTVLSENGGMVNKACDAVRLSRSQAYNLRDSDPAFAEAWQKAVDAGLDRLEDEVIRRGFEGVREPVYQGGKLVGHVQKYSDTLLIFFLKAHRKQYRDKQELTGPDGAPLVPGNVNFYLPKEDPLPDGGTGG